MIKPWKIISAINLVREMEKRLSQVGWHVALTGSVLYVGHSDNDLDIVVYPHKSIKSWRPFADSLRYDLNLEVVHEVFISLDMRQIFDEQEVHEYWRKIHQLDEKHVEVWRTSTKSGSKRVDVFVMR